MMKDMGIIHCSRGLDGFPRASTPAPAKLSPVDSHGERKEATLENNSAGVHNATSTRLICWQGLSPQSILSGPMAIGETHFLCQFADLSKMYPARQISTTSKTACHGFVSDLGTSPMPQFARKPDPRATTQKTVSDTSGAMNVAVAPIQYEASKAEPLLGQLVCKKLQGIDPAVVGLRTKVA